MGIGRGESRMYGELLFRNGGGVRDEKRHTIQDMPRNRICSWMDTGRIYSESPSDSMI